MDGDVKCEDAKSSTSRNGNGLGLGKTRFQKQDSLSGLAANQGVCTDQALDEHPEGFRGFRGFGGFGGNWTCGYVRYLMLMFLMA